MATKPLENSAEAKLFGARGQAFYSNTTANFELSPAELELLFEACRTLDDLESLNNALESDGVTVKGSTGQTRVHPALGEIRQHRLALGRLLSQLELPEPDGETLPTFKQAQARRAGKSGARARWGVMNG
jgi:hypothetical protein